MSIVTSTREVKVSINFGQSVYPVGRLAIRDRQIYFEYDSTFISKGLEISTNYLPLRPGLFVFEPQLFEGLPGVFNDSLSDGWGRLLFDRFIRSQGLLPSDITPLDRLVHIGSRALGALVFEPDQSNEINAGEEIILDLLAAETKQVLGGMSDDVLEELLILNGSSAGARPKALIGVDSKFDHIVHGVDDLPNGYAPWMVKFSNSADGVDSGAIEYVYALMAKEAGILMPDVHLFPAKRGRGYFAVKRFDRDQDRRYHMHTACGLLHSDFRSPSLDYEDLISLTEELTRDVREVERMYQLAVFNVLAHNRDDHAKNFSYLMDAAGTWKLSPAYDLTFSSGLNGEQSTMVSGEGRNPTVDHLFKLAVYANIKKERAAEIIDATKRSVSKWPTLAKEYGVRRDNISLIQKKINQQL